MLDGVSFTSPAGQTTAIIGSTGAGKTTLVNLVPRLFDATAGAVLVDGVDVRERRPRRCCGAASASCRSGRTCSPGTVASNLRYGKPDATDDEMWEALEIAQAADFVRGDARRARRRRSTRAARTCPAASASVWRSPGRWCASPEIYLFDDSFSALDLATDARLRAALAPVTADAHGDRRRPAGVDDQRPPTRSSCSRTAARSGSAPTMSCWRRARPTSRSSSRR